MRCTCTTIHVCLHRMDCSRHMLTVRCIVGPAAGIVSQKQLKHLGRSSSLNTSIASGWRGCQGCLGNISSLGVGFNWHKAFRGVQRSSSHMHLGNFSISMTLITMKHKPLLGPLGSGIDLVSIDSHLD